LPILTVPLLALNVALFQSGEESSDLEVIAIKWKVVALRLLRAESELPTFLFKNQDLFDYVLSKRDQGSPRVLHGLAESSFRSVRRPDHGVGVLAALAAR